MVISDNFEREIANIKIRGKKSNEIKAKRSQNTKKKLPQARENKSDKETKVNILPHKLFYYGR